MAQWKRTISDKDKLQETEAIRSTILGYLLQSKAAGDRTVRVNTGYHTTNKFKFGT